MKKLLAALLLCAMLMTLTACGYDRMQQTVSFYYPRREIVYGDDSGVIGAETRDAADRTDDLRYLLAMYMQGPLDETFYSPFPSGCKLQSVSTAGDDLAITLSSRFSSLEGLDLSIACASLARTALELSGAESVHIKAAAQDESGSAVNIILTRTSLLLEETAASEPTE